MVLKMVKKKIDDKKAMELYQQGYSDIQISKKFNCHWTSVRAWRMRRGLHTNYSKTEIDYEVATKLYNAGKSDVEIGTAIGCHPTSIYTWRKRNGLPANGLPRCIKEIEHLIPDNEKPWHDPESLFCDGAFLEKLTGKKIKVSSECTGEKE